jgi:hypothetical protein
MASYRATVIIERIVTACGLHSHRDKVHPGLGSPDGRTARMIEGRDGF